MARVEGGRREEFKTRKEVLFAGLGELCFQPDVNHGVIKFGEDL